MGVDQLHAVLQGHSGYDTQSTSSDSQPSSSCMTTTGEELHRQLCGLSDSIGVEACKRARNPGYYLKDDDPAYKTDEFRMYTHKVDTCPKRFRHDWTSCNFAHPAEKARRRDLEKWEYTGIACPQMKQERACKWGRDCPYAHSVFEYWLHPTRYRTQMCRHAKKGHKCPNRICFFAHNSLELRRNVPKPSISEDKLLMVYGPGQDIEKLFTAAIQGATPPAKDFGLWPGWSPDMPKRDDFLTRCPELAGDGFGDPMPMQNNMSRNTQAVSSMFQGLEPQTVPVERDLFSHLLPPANSRNINQPLFMDFLSQPPTSLPTAFSGGGFLPRFMDAASLSPGIRQHPLQAGGGLQDIVPCGAPTAMMDNPFQSYVPTSSFDTTSFSGFSQSSQQTGLDLEYMSRRSSGVSDDTSGSAHLRSLLQQAMHDQPMQINQWWLIRRAQRLFPDGI